MARRRSRAGQSGDLGALRAINSDGSSGAWLVEQGRVKASAEIAPLDVEDGLERNLQERGNLCRVLAAMEEVENPSAGLSPGRRRPAFDDGCQRAQFVFA